MTWTAQDIPLQTGRRVLITGANSGVGFHAALELARRGAEIILPARSEDKAMDAVRRIQLEVSEARLVPAVLDLASQASVRAFARFVDQRFPGPSIDMLINNAGVMAVPKRELTPDGFERQFATNFLGPFALTALIFPHLKSQPGTRIVTLASEVVHRGRIEFDNLQSERNYVPLYGTYSQSKLADLIFALELQRRLEAAGSPIASLGAHPGIAITNLQSNMTGFYKLIGPLFTPLVGQSAAQGALPELFAATSPVAKPGGYYGPDGAKERKGYPAPARVPDAAKDASVARRLWMAAEQLTGVTFGLAATS
ncbi:oxidoreductase [Bradyrhizobium sp. CB1717]|uniref:oxidoreductase n=1 Tax=Bradyrhizobium sp. CB1717 TaxID=3039154 RepID=UPI0024B25CDF|nr:oxidoreductase [Bradyrhizobium sp. CB1717]WFU28106.1 oxidoreductase [Bradyrhizobium sp. CB1717]